MKKWQYAQRWVGKVCVTVLHASCGHQLDDNPVFLRAFGHVDIGLERVWFHDDERSRLRLEVSQGHANTYTSHQVVVYVFSKDKRQGLAAARDFAALYDLKRRKVATPGGTLDDEIRAGLLSVHLERLPAWLSGTSR